MAGTPKSVRFGGHLLEVIKENENGISDNYNVVLQQIQDPTIKSSQMIGLLNQITSVVHVLDKRHKKLVHEIVSMQWAIREKEIIELYLDMLVELITANAVHQAQILYCLVRHFNPIMCQSKTSEPIVPLEEVFQLIHNRLRKIFTLIPLSTSLIVPIFASHYPFVKKELQALKWYVKNLICVAEYQPSLRRQIMEIIIGKTLKLDVLCPRDVIEKSTNDEENMFEMETDNAYKSETFVDKLDTVLQIILEYIRNICYKDGHLSPTADVFLSELLPIFDKAVLPIHDSSHVQFIFFYICSFENKLLEKFRDHLWKKFQDPGTAVILRQTVLSYFASLYARGKYISLPGVLEAINVLSKWIHSYLNEREGTAGYTGGPHDAFRHGVFYSACQALFYILIFRVKQILDMPNGFELLRNLHLEHIVMSRLNPLKYCINTVVNMFASLMRQHQIVYCDTVIEKNNRHCLPISGQSNMAGSINPLDSFFPFDPYCLKSSSSLFEDIYQEWEGRVPQLDDKIGKTCDKDNELMTVTPMDIPNILDDEKSFAGSLGGKTYGVSPGFSLITPSPF